MSDFDARADDASRALGNATPPMGGPGDVRRRLRARRRRTAALASTGAAFAIVAVAVFVGLTRDDHRPRVETVGSTTTTTTTTTVTEPTTRPIVAPTTEPRSVHTVTTIPPASSSTSTTAPATTPTTAPGTPEEVADGFFVAWVGNDDAGLTANGTTSAVAAARAGRAGGTSHFVFSNCQGTAGSIYCTWVRAGERVRLRVDDTSTPHLVIEFRRDSLDGQSAAEEFLTAWEFSNPAAVGVLTDANAASEAVALASHAHDAWQFDSCSGAAGSLFCTWRDGHATLVAQVENVQPPRLVMGVRYTP